MIRHVVFFSLKSPEHLDVAQAALQTLADIPDVAFFEVARNAKRDGIGNEIDLVVYAEFADYTALERYKAHPIYHACIQHVRPLREQRFAVDFETLSKP